MTTEFTAKTKCLYDTDYYLWLQQTAKSLASRDFTTLDLDNLLDEIESLGKREKKAIKSKLRIVILHLLKWNYQVNKRSQSWIYSIAEHRQRLYDDFETSPSLKRYCQDIFLQVYQEGRKLAAKETGLSLNHFPETCPFSLENILDENWLEIS
ncbi:DUF29 domain-containing protein [Crocosphaera watsonii]|uniref:DUF29 domain-containing protein n=1 Tax=Crocosphaera watsonii WH 0401 TaxID=555881 RepID=T2JG05_CROWT|nr:DUF29 domain-containing protein [Crocosphaera watsonii]CCQ63979.1 Protein of unknown function DUF29 [Crocosphaera watsonii WH 0401]